MTGTKLRVFTKVGASPMRVFLRNISVISAIVTSFLTSHGSPLLLSSAYAADIKVAVVDTQGVLGSSIVGKAAKNNVESELKKGQAKLAQLKADFEKATTDLGKQAAVLSGSALEERKEALEKKRTDYERAAMDLRESVMRKNDVELGKAVKEIEAVVAEIAADNGYTFIFERDRQTVVYASQGIDITEEVIKALDKKKVAL